MALTQKRFWDLDLYVQLEPGDPGYIDPSELVFGIDHTSFTEMKRLPYTNIAGLSSGVHVEKDTLTGLASPIVTVEFDEPFVDAPNGSEPQVYRTVDVGGGNFRRQDVLFSYSSAAWLSATGFSLTIDASESLTDVVVEYLYQ